MTDKPFLKITNLSAAYNHKSTVVSDINFGLNEGELGCLLGPSGCGKTTILRAISGFQNLQSGSISLAGNVISKPNSMVAPEQRNVGMVFQDHALFPHLSIVENISFGLHTLTHQERATRVASVVELVGMQDYVDQYPHELSGGQSQRVALARAIAPQPKLLLMDEPFSNLDTELRESLGHEVRGLLKKLGITAIMVTHDQHDAFALGDKIGVISQGKLIQWDSAFNLYHEPKSRFVANFIGDGLFIAGEITGTSTITTSFGEVHGKIINADGFFEKNADDSCQENADDSCQESADGSYTKDTGGAYGKIDILIRPDDVKHDPESSIRGKIVRKAFKGAQTLYTITTNSDDILMSLLPSHENYEIGEVIGLSIDADHLVCFAKQI